MIVLTIDLAILAIIAFCGWRGYKDGLIRGVFGVVALVASIFIANIAADAYSTEFTGMLKPFVGGLVESALTELREKNIEYDPGAHDHDISLPDFGTAYEVLRWIGLPEPSAVRVAKLSVDEDSATDGKPAARNERPADEEPADVEAPETHISERIADKLSSILAYVAVFAIAFILLAIIFAVVGNLIGVVFSLPGFKLLDAVAGIAFGLAKGLILVLTLATVVRYFGLLAPDTIERTTILNQIVNNNPIANMLGL